MHGFVRAWEGRWQLAAQGLKGRGDLSVPRGGRQAGVAWMAIIIIVLLIGLVAAYLVGGTNDPRATGRDTSRVLGASVTDAGTQYVSGVQALTTGGFDVSQVTFTATSSPTATPPTVGLLDPSSGTAVLQSIQGGACLTPPCTIQYNVPSTGGQPTNGVTGVGSASPDYIFFVPGLKLTVCSAIDQMLYGMDPSQAPPSAGSFAFESSTGNATISGGSPAWSSGYSSGCVLTTTGYTYFTTAFAQ